MSLQVVICFLSVQQKVHLPSVGICPWSTTVAIGRAVEFNPTLCPIEELLLLWEEDISSALSGRKFSLLANASPPKTFTGSAVPPAK